MFIYLNRWIMPKFEHIFFKDLLKYFACNIYQCTVID